MNIFKQALWNLFVAARPVKTDGPHPQALPVDNLRHFLSHPNPGIVAVPEPMAYHPNYARTLDFLAPGHEHSRPTRTFDRCDTSLTPFGPEFFKPDREIQHI